MKLLTIFRAYQKAEGAKHRAAMARKTNFGIGVNQDPYAKVWQKLDRKSHRFEARIFGNLGNKTAFPLAEKCAHKRVIGDENLIQCLDCGATW